MGYLGRIKEEIFFKRYLWRVRQMDRLTESRPSEKKLMIFRNSTASSTISSSTADQKQTHSST